MNLAGLSTGIDTNALVTQLMEINKRTLISLQTQQAKWTSKQTALQSVETKLSSFQTAVTALSDSQKLRGFKATSSDPDIITATASSSGFEGNHTIVIDSLASAQRIIHEDGMAYAEDRVGQGTFIYAYNHKEVSISTTETTTLADLVGLINNDPSNPGITASLLKYNDKYHLVLGGNQSGAENTISINSSNTNVVAADSAFTISGADAGLNSKIMLLDQFSGTLGLSDKITITGTNPNGTAITPVDVAVTKDTTIQRLLDEITAAFGSNATATIVDGKINLVDNVSGASLTSLQLSFTKDPDAGTAALTLPAFAVSTKGGEKVANLTGFAPDKFKETQAATNSKVRIDGYPPTGWLERDSNTIDDVIPGVTLDLHAPTTGVQVNLTRQMDDFKTKLQAMVTSYNQLITLIKEKTAYNTDKTKVGVLISDYAVSTVRSALRQPLINQAAGFSKDTDSFSMPANIGIEMDKDGMLNIDSSKLDEAITKDYLGVLSIVGASQTGSSSNSNIKFYNATEKTAGGSYEVQANFDDTHTLVSARIRLAGETAWRDAAVSGNVITGSNATDSQSRYLHPEGGLSLTVEYNGASTQTATVQVKQGFAGKLKSVLKDILNAQYGPLEIDQKGTADAIKNLDSRIDRETTRLEKIQKQLVARFSRLERTMALLQAQQQELS